MRRVYKKKTISRICLAALAGVVAFALAGCHTVKGIGRDVEAMAQGGQDIIDGKHH